MQNQIFTISTVNLLFLLFVPFFLMAQNSTESFQKEFEWQKADETKTIIINVKRGAKGIQMDFEGSIVEGNLYLTVFDPEGNKAARLSLETSGSNHSDIHVETIDGSGSNSNSNTNCNYTSIAASGSNVTISTTTTTTTSASDSDEVTVKSKNKKKNKNKDGKGYSVTSTSSDSKGAKGIMKKRISNPMAGKWKFVFEIEGVTGTLSADIDQD